MDEETDLSDEEKPVNGEVIYLTREIVLAGDEAHGLADQVASPDHEWICIDGKER